MWLAAGGAALSGCKSMSDVFSSRSAGPSEAELKARQDRAQARRQRYVSAHPALAPGVETAILGGKLVQGMSADEIRASWGEPNDVKTNMTTYRIYEQFIYKNPAGGFDYVYVDNGKLKGTQHLSE